MSDGPNGVRGELSFDIATPSVVVPVGIVQGATWDPDLIGRIGDLLGVEARRKAVHVLLAPAVNLQRTPVGGRTFEYFSEDPELTASLGAATIRAVQANGVAVTVKHFVANDTEIERNSVDVIVDERVLRELYLRPFEVAVREAGAWGVMSAYNRLEGEFCAANTRLLEDILRGEWGFDGFVVSDWGGAHDTVPSVHGGLSIEMPGPARVYGPHLEAAVAEGAADEHSVDARVRDVLVLAQRTDALARALWTSPSAPSTSRLIGRCVVKSQQQAWCSPRNVDHALPLDGDDAALSLAVIGPNAADTRIMGGGSSSLRSLPHQSVLEALRSRVPNLVHEVGCFIDAHAPMPDRAQIVGTDGEPGLELRFINGTDPEAEPVVVRRTTSTVHRFFFSLPDGVTLPCILQMRGAVRPDGDRSSRGRRHRERQAVRASGRPAAHPRRGVAPAQ